MLLLRKKDTELRRNLLECAGKIECTEGVGAINIRRLAAEANIAVGTVYNYFESKQEVLLALTEAYWQHTLEEMRVQVTAERFSEQIAQIITFLRTKMNDCAQVLMHSLHDDAATGRVRMEAMKLAMKQALVDRLNQDETIRKDVWNEHFTKDQFSNFVLQNLVFLMQQTSENEDVFLQIIEQILYE